MYSNNQGSFLDPTKNGQAPSVNKKHRILVFTRRIQDRGLKLYSLNHLSNWMNNFFLSILDLRIPSPDFLDLLNSQYETNVECYKKCNIVTSLKKRIETFVRKALKTQNVTSFNAEP